MGSVVDRPETKMAIAIALMPFVFAACGSGAVSSPNASGTPGAGSTPVASATAAANATPANLVEGPIKVAAPSLANNVIGEPAELSVVVLLPAGYNDTTKRYPTIYFLTGFGDQASSVLGYFGNAMMNPAPGVQPMIVVGVDGYNSLYGSFYANSPITGNWEDAIVKDLVGWADKTYRTIPSAASRAIAGHSMGGAGAWNIAMKHPDAFSAVEAITPGVTNAQGVLSTQMFVDEATIRSELATLADLEKLSPDELRKQFTSIVAGSGGDVEFALAYGAAWAGDLSSKTLMRFPYKEVGGKLVADPDVLEIWNQGFGDQEGRVAANKANLAKLKGIRIDYASADQYSWSSDGCKYLDGVLTRAGIDHKTTRFEGDHSNHVKATVEQSVVPFFAGLLEGGR